MARATKLAIWARFTGTAGAEVAGATPPATSHHATQAIGRAGTSAGAPAADVPGGTRSGQASSMARVVVTGTFGGGGGGGGAAMAAPLRKLNVTQTVPLLTTTAMATRL